MSKRGLILSFVIAGIVGACGKTTRDTADNGAGERNGNGGTGGSGVACAGPITFADSQIEAAVREAVGIPAGDLRFEDVSALSRLMLWDQRDPPRPPPPPPPPPAPLAPGEPWGTGGVGGAVDEVTEPVAQYPCPVDQSPGQAPAPFPADADLAGIECLQGLTHLDLYNLDATASDLRPLAGLTGLTWLRLDNNAIDDVSPLAGLRSLTDLYLANNEITDLAPLACLTSLAHLAIDDNQVADLTPLVANAGLDSGDWVRARGNPIDCDEQIDNIHALWAREVLIRTDCE